MTTPAMFAREGVRVHRVDLSKVLLTALFLVPFVCGWLAAQTVRACWTVISWTWAALVVGWRTAYGRAEGGG